MATLFSIKNFRIIDADFETYPFESQRFDDEACNDFDIDMQSSYVIGDMEMSDMILAKNIVAKGILVLTGVADNVLEATINLQVIFPKPVTGGRGRQSNR